jgi:hypothetical protein
LGAWVVGGWVGWVGGWAGGCVGGSGENKAQAYVQHWDLSGREPARDPEQFPQVQMLACMTPRISLARSRVLKR